MHEKDTSLLDSNSQAAARITSKQARVLAELNETLNTLTSLIEVLDDIDSLSDPADDAGENPGSTDDSAPKRSVTRKMHDLLAELQKWEELEGNHGR